MLTFIDSSLHTNFMLRNQDNGQRSVILIFVLKQFLTSVRLKSQFDVINKSSMQITIINIFVFIVEFAGDCLKFCPVKWVHKN